MGGYALPLKLDPAWPQGGRTFFQHRLLKSLNDTLGLRFWFLEPPLAYLILLAPPDDPTPFIKKAPIFEALFAKTFYFRTLD